MSDTEQEPIEEPTPDLTPEAEDRDTRRRAKKAKVAEEKRLDRNRKVIEGLLSSEDGRAWFAELLFIRCGLFINSENVEHHTQTVHYVNGMRAVGLGLHEEALQLVKPQYMVLLGEHLHKP